jgi:hypothetical protein
MMNFTMKEEKGRQFFIFQISAAVTLKLYALFTEGAIPLSILGMCNHLSPVLQDYEGPRVAKGTFLKASSCRVKLSLNLECNKKIRGSNKSSPPCTLQIFLCHGSEKKFDDYFKIL